MKKVDINIMYLSVGLAGITSVALLFMSACYASYQFILFLLRQAGYLQVKTRGRRRQMNHVLMIYFKNGEIAKFEEVGSIEVYSNELRFDYRFQNSVYHAKLYLETIGGYTYSTIVKPV